MAEQTTDTVNPGQAIYDALSDEAKAAVDALPDDVFAGEAGKIAASHLANEILEANRLNDAVWSVQCDGRTSGTEFIVVNVGSVNTASWSDHSLRFVVDPSGLDMDAIAEVPGLEKTDRLYESLPLAEVRVANAAILEDIPDQILRAHEVALVRHPEQSWKRNMRANWHRDDWRVKLAALTGIEIPAPAYVPDARQGLPMEVANDTPTNPGQALYNALSDEAKTAVDALPDDLFADDEGVDHSQWFLRSLRIAHQRGPDSWAIVTFNMSESDFVALNVTGENVISLGDKLRFVVQRDLVDEREFEDNLVSFISFDRYKRRKYLVQIGVDSATPDSARAEFDRVHQLTVKRLARGKVGLQARNHRDDMRVKLALLTGEEVPAPAYVPESTYGLPNGLRIVAKSSGMVRGPEAVTAIDAEDVSLEDLQAAVDALPEWFASAGLTYTDTQIGSFYTALQTKGFVILSGISGTGKSKIAQRFSEMLPDIAAQPQPSLAEDYVQVTVRPYMKKYKRIRLLNEVSGGLPVPEPGTSVTVPLLIDGQEGTCRVWNRPGTNADTYIFMQGELGEVFRKTHGEHFALRFHVDEAEDRLTAIEMRTELPTEPVPDTLTVSMSNHLFLPVRPDWRDGKALIGYHNPLSGEYVRTDFLDFVISAADDFAAGNRNAFFVILDEMNLAHVEYYFADVLSVIESGRDAEGWTVEGIPLAVGEEDADLPETLRLPPNLYIVGTVNMDETTHPFSPKVLDRAFTIELTEVDFTDYPPEQMETGEVDEAEKQALLKAFTQGGRYPRIDKPEIAAFVADHEKYRDALQSLNTSLRRSRMHFGYRVFDEIMQFAYNAEENGLFTIDEAFDHAVLMKVLPKFNGSRGKLQTALFELIHWCRAEGTLTPAHRSDLESRFANLIDQGQPFDQIVKTGEDSIDDNWRYPATGKRAALMMQDLYTDGFASFG